MFKMNQIDNYQDFSLLEKFLTFIRFDPSDIVKKFTIIPFGNSHNITIEDLLISRFLNMLNLQKSCLYRPAGAWEVMDAGARYIKIDYEKINRMKLRKIVKDIKTVEMDNILNAFGIVGKQGNRSICIKDRNISIFIKRKECLIQFLIDDDIDEETLKINDKWQLVGAFIKHFYTKYYFDDFSLCKNIYNEFCQALMDNSRKTVFETGSNFFKSYQKIRAVKEQHDFEKWINLEMNAACVDTMVTPIRKSIEKEEIDCKIMDVKCRNCLLKELERQKDSINPEKLINKKICFLSYPSLRAKIWSYVYSKQIYDIQQSEKEILNKNDQVKEFLEFLKKFIEIDPNKQMKFKIPEFNHKILNNNKIALFISNISQWSIMHSCEIEFFRTVLFSIYVATINFEGRACRHNIRQLNELWYKIKDELKNFIVNYLALYNKNENSVETTVMTPEWLIGWYTSHYINSKTFNSYTGSEALYSPEETLLFHRHYSTLCLYVLFWMKKMGDTKFHTFSDNRHGYEGMLDATIYLLCEYAYIDGNLTREASLYRTLRYMWSHQSILYTLRESYRDHLHHVIELCLMGLCFMHTKKELDKDLPLGIDFITYENDKKLRNWIVGALFHDVGYGVEILNLPLDHLTFFEAELVAKFRSDIKNKMNELEKQFGQDSCQSLKKTIPNIRLPEKNLEKFDHGIISALNIASIIDTHRQSWLEDMSPAIEAAALHNCAASKIDQRTIPMAFLLFLCDHLQEWDRPYIEGEQMRYSMLVNLIRLDRYTKSHGISLIKWLCCQRLKLGSDGNLVSLDKGVTFTLEFDVAEGKGYYPPLAWVGLGRDLQKISNCPFPITIKLKHPININRVPHGSELEMDLFQHFLRESGKSAPGSSAKDTGKREIGNAVLREWVANARKGEHWYKYHQGEQYEVMEFELHKVDSKKYIPAFPPRLVKHFISWRKKYRAGIYEPAGLNSFEIM